MAHPDWVINASVNVILAPKELIITSLITQQASHHFFALTKCENPIANKE